MPFGSILYEALVDATGSGALGNVILAAADSEIGVDEVYAYWLEEHAAPVRIASSGKVGSSLSRAALHADRFHAIDPLRSLALSVADGAPMRFGRVATADIQNAIYRRECYERPGFREKLSFIGRRGSRHYVLSFYRNRDRRTAPIGALDELAQLAFPLLRKHADLCGSDSNLPLAARVERRLTTGYPGLTRREREVCARTLIGMTAEAIAVDLGIRQTTVLTYRRRAYERYGISTAHEMIATILP